MAHGDDLHLARLLPQFKELSALIGYSPKTTDTWAPFALLVADHGWNRLLRAARQLQKQDRVYPRDYAVLCHRFKQDEEQAAKEAADKAESDTRRAQQARDRVQAAKDFAACRQKHGL